MLGRTLSCLLFAVAGPVLAQDGRALYHGFGPEPLKARIGRAESRGLTCAGCHGRSGEGGGEGRVAIPAIGRPALLSAGAYDEEAFRRVLAEGVTPGGRRLASSMPRYDLSTDEARALWDYLSDIGTEDRAGVTSDGVVIAIPALREDLGEAEALRAALERRWREVGPRAVHGRVLRFETLSLDRGQAPATHRAAGIFLVIGAGDERTAAALELVGSAIIPIIAAHADAPSGSDVIRIAPSERDLRDRLSALVRAGGIEVRKIGLPIGLDSNVTLVVTGDAGVLEAFAASKPPLAGRRVVLTSRLAGQAPKAVAGLLDLGAEVFALRGAADPFEASRFAELIVTILDKALVEAGRDLTRSRFLASLRRLRITPEGWPFLDFSRTPASSAIETIRLKR